MLDYGAVLYSLKVEGVTPGIGQLDRDAVPVTGWVLDCKRDESVHWRRDLYPVYRSRGLRALYQQVCEIVAKGTFVSDIVFEPIFGISFALVYLGW